jgi:hypothetical protein
MDRHYSFGLVVSDEKIDIFHIDPSSVNYLNENLPDLCRKILAKYFTSKQIQDMQWTHTAGGAHSKIIFNEQNNFATTAIYTNGAVFQPYCYAYKIEEYEAALNDPRGLELALLDGYEDEDAKSSFSIDPVKQYLVHTPYHEHYKIHVMTPPFFHNTGECPVILVDTEKFISYWKRQSSKLTSKNTRLNKIKSVFHFNQKNSEDRLDVDDRELLSSTLETSLKHDIPYEMACGVSLSFDNKIRFTNGRHRTVNLSNLGAPFIPVQSSSHGEERFRELFEWANKPGQSPEQARRSINKIKGADGETHKNKGAI